MESRNSAAIAIRPALFCCSIFIPSFALLSLAAQLMPELPRSPFRWALIALGLLFLVVANGAPARTLLKPFGIVLRADETSADWTTAAVALQPWLNQASLIVTPDDMHALYYLGDYGLAANPSRLSEVAGKGGNRAEEFSRDPRTGRPVVGKAESLRLIKACYPDGLFVADFTSYPAPWATSESKAMSGLIEREMEPIDLPSKSGVVAFRWESSDAMALPCPSLAPTVPARTEDDSRTHPLRPAPPSELDLD